MHIATFFVTELVCKYMSVYGFSNLLIYLHAYNITATVKRWYQVLVAVSVIITIISLILWLALIGYSTKNGENVCIHIYMYVPVHVHIYVHVCISSYPDCTSSYPDCDKHTLNVQL